MLALSLAAAAAAASEPSFPRFSGWVVDSAGVLEQQPRDELTAIAKALDEQGAAQLAVVTVDPRRLGSLERPAYAVKLFETWRLGHGRQKADGILVLIVPGPAGHRGLKVEVGHDLEGILPDGKVGALMDANAREPMRKGDYGAAAVALAHALAATVHGAQPAAASAALGACLADPERMFGKQRSGLHEALEDVCTRLWTERSAELAVVLVPAARLDGLRPSQYAARELQRWPGGEEKRDRRLLILIATGSPGKDAVQLRAGSAFAAALPTARASALVESHALPLVARQEYPQAAIALARAVAAELSPPPPTPAAAEAPRAAAMETALAAPPAVAAAPRWRLSSWSALLGTAGTAALVVMLVLAYRRRRHPGRAATVVAAATVALAVVGFASGGVLLLFPALPVVYFFWRDLKKHRCPKDGGWLDVTETVVRPATEKNEGVDRTTARCRSCGFESATDESSPRLSHGEGAAKAGRTARATGASAGTSFRGGGGGTSGGGGADREY